MLRLPAEMRNKVYKVVFGGLELRFIRFETSSDNGQLYSNIHLACRRPEDTGWHWADDAFALTRVCRQVYSESRLIPWSTNVPVKVGAIRPINSAMLNFFSCNQQRADAITSIHVSIHNTDLTRDRTSRHWPIVTGVEQSLISFLRLALGMASLRRLVMEYTGFAGSGRWNSFSADLIDEIRRVRLDLGHDGSAVEIEVISKWNET